MFHGNLVARSNPTVACDIERDWKGWSIGERLIAAGLLGVLFAGIPIGLLLAAGLH